MKVLIVLEFDVPDPEAVPAVIRAMNPPDLPGFTGTARIVVDPEATQLTDWLDE